MAFFKFRKTGDEPSASSTQPESVEAMRRRAKHRLMGAAVLVVIGFIGFPMLFDKQPRPILVDMSIDIPDRNKVKPLSIPAPAAMPAESSVKATPVPPPVSAPAAAPMIEEKATPPNLAATPEGVKKIAEEEPKTADKPAAKPVPPVARADDASKAQALLDGRDPETKVEAHEGRYVVQVGAFADANRAREVRLKVEKAGLKTYTHVAETKDGRRIRVRVGPFAAKAEADKAAEKIKKLDLPAVILTL